MVVPKPNHREAVLELMKKKEDLEEQINVHGQTLRRNDVGMADSLVDANGFPRNDLDVYQVREARHQIICLQNDLKETMAAIERGLHEIHASEAPSAASACEASTKMSGANAEMREEDLSKYRPFIRIDKIIDRSPAQEADFKINDEIVAFGSVNATNFRGLAHIAEIVNNRKDQAIQVKVIRQTELLDLCLIPHTWSGRGLLGCNIVLCDNVER